MKRKPNSPKLWSKNYTLLIAATVMGTAGSIAGGFALSFLVFDETGSTLASALVLAIQLVPYVFVPLIAAPWMDRLPRKTFLVGGDICSGVIHAAMGAYLLSFDFSYTGYLAVSLALACIGSVDELAYMSLYPDLLPAGAEQKGYAVSSMLYPVLQVALAPLAAVLLDVVGVANLLLAQGAMALLAASTESFIRIDESSRKIDEPYSLRAWANDIREAFDYLKNERGLRSIFEYMAVTNGVANGYSAILVAFFRSTPGFSTAMYSLFSVAEFAGRTLGSVLQYRIKIPDGKKFGFTFFVYQAYEVMDMILLWIPYPLMLANRAVCGFLGNNSAILRSAATQRYIPAHMRARVNSYADTMRMAMCSLCALLGGALGEVLDYRWCMTLCGAAACIACWALIWGRRRDVRKVYEYQPETPAE